MNIHITYKVSKTPDIEQEINHHIEKLGRRLHVFRPELVHLHGSMEENSVPQGFSIALNLRLPSGQMAAREAAATATGCIKAAFDDLLGEVAKHKDKLRNERKWVRRRSDGRAPQQLQVPFEHTLAAVHPLNVTDGDVTGYINANLKRLERFVDRELRYRRNTGRLDDGNITREDVVDEVVATALGDGEEKPQVLGLEPWLYRLAIRAIDVIGRRDHEALPTISLDQSARKQNVRASDESQLQFHQPDEMFTRGDVTADLRTSTPEQIASSDELVMQVETALLGAKREDREAFILFAVEGFTPQEIAAISDRALEQVHASIGAARSHLKKTVATPREFQNQPRPRTA
jgi:DNA-directed RNA polymerase specialized sigma24 family protein/ribosome-associated translation inhibitor RaiA